MQQVITCPGPPRPWRPLAFVEPCPMGVTYATEYFPETPAAIEMEFDTFDYVRRPTAHAKYGGRRRGVGWRYG